MCLIKNIEKAWHRQLSTDRSWHASSASTKAASSFSRATPWTTLLTRTLPIKTLLAQGAALAPNTCRSRCVCQCELCSKCRRVSPYPVALTWREPGGIHWQNEAGRSAGACRCDSGHPQTWRSRRHHQVAGESLTAKFPFHFLFHPSRWSFDNIFLNWF